MFRASHAGVFVEIGQAIGNVSAKLVGHSRRNAELVAGILERRLAEGTRLRLPSLTETLVRPEEHVIDAAYRVIYDKEEQ